MSRWRTRSDRDRRDASRTSRTSRAAGGTGSAPRAADTAVRLLGAALDAVPAAVVVVDASHRVVARNAAAAGFDDPRHGDALAAAAVSELLDRALHGRPGQRVLELYGPPRRVLRIEATPAHDGEEVLGAVALVHDVTEQQRVAAVRRDFVANVSHELKTPVGALSLLAETLADADDPDTVARLSARLRDEAIRLSATVDDLLMLSRVEHDVEHEDPAGPPAREEVDLVGVVAAAVDRVSETARQRRIGIGMVVPGPPPGSGPGVAVGDAGRGPGSPRPLVLGDRVQLVSVVFNLLDNAVKYSETGGRVEVRVATGAGRVAVAVQDRGIGIPAAGRERIFERFYRIDRARSRRTGGTGLGLSIVRHVVANHGGEIAVASREGEGATFTVILPLAGPEPPDRAGAAARPPGPDGDPRGGRLR